MMLDDHGVSTDGIAVYEVAYQVGFFIFYFILNITNLYFVSCILFQRPFSPKVII